MIKSLLSVLSLIIISFPFISCDKNKGDANSATWTLSYGDSIIYLRTATNDYIVYPVTPREGRYEAFPEGIEIDDNTGSINVTRSETGLRYRITHTATDGTKSTTTIVLSGINFADRYYRLSQHDSIAVPIYNANPTRSLPVTGSIFDEGGLANSSGCSIKTVNGQINLAESVRNGLFGNNPANDSRKDIEIVYKLNDGSNKAVNKLKVRLYYYTSMSTVAPDLVQTLQDRENAGVFIRGLSTSGILQTAKPRPPCVIIIAN